MNKSPAFQIYPKDFLSDEKVVMMNNQQLGCYLKLILHCWIEGSIPSNVDEIAWLCREDSSAMGKLWTAISKCFSPAIDNPERLIHPRLEKEREKQEEFKNERSNSGKKGAEARWNKASQGVGSANSLAYGSAIKQPLAKNGSSSAIAIAITNNKKEKITKKKKGADPILKTQALEVLRFLNLKANRQYREVDTNLAPIAIRLGSGVSVADCRAIIAKKCREWRDDEKMEMYLRPLTLFNKSKFEQYLGELLPEEKPDAQ